MIKRRGDLTVRPYKVGDCVYVGFNLRLRSLGPDAPVRRNPERGMVMAILPRGRYQIRPWNRGHPFFCDAVELWPDSHAFSYEPGDCVEADLVSGILPGIVVEAREDTDWVLLWTEFGRLPLVWCRAFELYPVALDALTAEERAPYERLKTGFADIRADHEAKRQAVVAGRQEGRKQANKRRS